MKSSDALACPRARSLRFLQVGEACCALVEPARSMAESPNERDVAVVCGGAGVGVVDMEAGRVRHLEIHKVAEVDEHNVGSGSRAEAGRQAAPITLEAIPHQLAVNGGINHGHKARPNVVALAGNTGLVG